MSEGYTVAQEGGVWAQTEDGPIHVEQGAGVPNTVLASEVTRLANGGVLEGYDILDVEAEVLPEVANLAELKVRVGDDPDTARRFLDQETSRETPRTTWVTHLQGVIDAAGNTSDATTGSEDLGGVAVSEDGV
ncbi:hypothetical protein [Nocardioides sp.]|uniref:hypothetical protein n=1 Tax=Nocardioides sp. TaxID=35761 RepID=UPI002CD1CE41|nr:hypothetical protein [Nocardioides sp.]HXH77311.1 hypothetical protein [Nocardioides sp.]